MIEHIKKCKDCVNYDETKVRQCICYNNECKPNEDATHCCEFVDRVNRIKNAIEHLDNLIGMVDDNQNTDYDSDFKLAIRSLQAWDEVLNELEDVKVAYYQDSAFITSNAIQLVIDFINQKLAEIEE